MLTIFFTIVFISELIITHWIISKVLQFQKVISSTNEKLVAIQPEIKSNITNIRIKITKIHSHLRKFTNFIDDKKVCYSNLIEKNIFSRILSIILELPYKKIMSVLEVILMIKKVFK